VPRRDPRFVACLAAICLAAALSALDQTVVATALPHIIDSLGGAALLGWVFTAFFLGATATVPVVGNLADLVGRRLIFLTAVVVFTIGSLLCGAATSMPMLVVCRCLQGIGAGGIQTCALIVMADMFPPRQRAKWQVIHSAGYATASAIGPTLGGILSDTFSWRWIFLINGPICLITFAALWFGLPRTAVVKRAGRRIDWSGGVWSIAGVSALLLALSWGGHEYEWVSPQIGVTLALVAVAFGVLYVVERRATNPVIPGDLLRSNVPALSSLGGVANSVVWFSMLLLVPLRLQLVLGVSATAAGALMTPAIVLGPLGSVFAGQMLGRTGRYRLMSIVAGVLQVTGLLLFVLLPPDIGPWGILASIMVVSLGTGFAGPTFMVVFQNAIPNARMGAGVGMFSLLRTFGASAGTAIAGSIVGASAAVMVTAAQASEMPDGLGPVIQHAALVPLGAAILVLLAALFMRNRPLRTTRHEADSTEDAPRERALAAEGLS
jgi:EmrB/QacA subfamily drug resistance transporter